MPSTENGSVDLFGGIPNPTSLMFEELINFCEVYTPDVNASLPWLAAEIGHNDGYAVMLRFVRGLSGTRLYVSKDHKRFTMKVGYPLSASTHRRFLVEASEAFQLDVPSAWGVFLALRRAAIVIALRSGTSERDVSRQFGVTMRSLR